MVEAIACCSMLYVLFGFSAGMGTLVWTESKDMSFKEDRQLAILVGTLWPLVAPVFLFVLGRAFVRELAGGVRVAGKLAGLGKHRPELPAARVVK